MLFSFTNLMLQKSRYSILDVRSVLKSFSKGQGQGHADLLQEAHYEPRPYETYRYVSCDVIL